MGKQWETLFLGGGSKIAADGDCSHEINRHLFLGRKSMTNLDSILKSRDITLPTKVHLVKWKWSHSDVRLFATPWTIACQVPPSMEFSRQEYWSGLPFPSPDLPDQGLNLGLPHGRQTLYHLSHQLSPSQSYGFSSSHIWMWGLNHKESWVLKNWCFWTVVLEKTLESPLDCKEIKPVNPKGNQSWILIERTDAQAEAPILWPPDVKNWLTGKDPDAGKDWRQAKGMTMTGWHHRVDGHEFEQAPGVGSLLCWAFQTMNIVYLSIYLDLWYLSSVFCCFQYKS